jgi:type IV pilus assembly protein PilE
MNRKNLSPLRRSQEQASGGFSLIELLITIGILSILAAIAIPSYQAYVLRSHRTEAKTALLDLASMEERFFSTSNLYSTAPSDLGYTAAAFPINTFSGYYTITQSAFTPAVAPSAAAPAGTPASYTFTATATAIGNQTNDTNCLTFTLGSNGAQTATPNPNNDCWN